MGTVPEKIENIIGVKINSSEMVSWAGHVDCVDQTETVDGPILCGIDEGGDNKGIPAVVVPSGDVVLCVKDWSMEYILGNLLKCTFEDLYQSKRYKEVIQIMASDNGNVLCRNCEHAISVKKIQESEQKLKELQIDRTDEISQKLDEIWQIYLYRPIDADGLIYFYDKIKKKKMNLTEIVRHVKNSSEYLSQRFKIN
jgi:radical SAM protein with 4Fe4S-binding SPASM domain